MSRCQSRSFFAAALRSASVKKFWREVESFNNRAGKSANSKWEAIRTGKAQPKDAAEEIDLAKLSTKKSHYALATRLYREAFRKDSALADNLDLANRYNAACYAVLAAAGKGDDAADLKAEQSAALRQEALAWLKADLASWTKRVVAWRRGLAELWRPDLSL